MATLFERKIIDLKQGSWVICLPKSWFRYYGLGPGDKVQIIANDEISIRPLKNIKNYKKPRVG